MVHQLLIVGAPELVSQGVLVLQALSFADSATGNAETHFGLNPFLLRLPPFSQHQHAPQDCVSTLSE